MRENIPSVLKLIVAVFFLSILPEQTHALTPEQVFDKVKDSIVVVKTLDAQGKVKGFGSGVLLPSGKIATNCHVVKEGATYQVGRGKELVNATLYAEDGDKDICILDAKGITGKPAQLGKAANLKVGGPVYAVGAPQGLELSISDGIVAQLRGGPPPLIQTTAAISPGSSGGGLFDGEGRLVGLTTLYMKGGQSLNFAMPVEWIEAVTPGRKQVAGGTPKIIYLMYAYFLEQRKDWQGLLDWCREWTDNESENAIAWGVLGEAYAEFNRYDDAIKAYSQALRLNPEDADAWNDLGNTYAKLNRPNDAIEVYRQAIRINPENADTWFNLGVTEYELKRYNDAMEDYRQALRISPENNKTWNNLANTYAKLNRPNDAIEAYRQSLRIDSESALTWDNLGNGYSYLKRYDDAIEAYRQALRINPENASAWFNLGVVYGKLKRYKDETEAYRQALRINPEHAAAWFNLGINYLLSDNKTAALDAHRELRRLDPEKADKLFNLIVPR